jgi:hypothetical protein
LCLFQLDALQTAVDEASERRNALAAEEREALDYSKKNPEGTNDVEQKAAAAELALKIADKDAEIQAYALLLLHYCSGMQKAREMLASCDDEDDEDDEGDDEDDENILVT